jgi:hypothetical protein
LITTTGRKNRKLGAVTAAAPTPGDAAANDVDGTSGDTALAAEATTGVTETAAAGDFSRPVVADASPEDADRRTPATDRPAALPGRTLCRESAAADLASVCASTVAAVERPAAEATS